MNILIAYQNYLRHLQEESTIERKKDKGFHASSSGSCYRKQLYAYFEYPSGPIEDKGLRVLRLGTIVHKDVEDSIHHYIKTNAKEIADNNISIFSEHKVKIPELNIVGTLDVAVYDGNSEILDIYDVKTAAAYTWTKHFGRKDNRQQNANENYKLQLGTYALGMQSQVQPKKTNLHLFWYNKNTSMVREQLVISTWIDKAFEYWTSLNEYLVEYGKKFVDYLEPEIEYGVPFEEWECKYCQYESICPSTIKQRKERKPRRRRK